MKILISGFSSGFMEYVSYLSEKLSKLDGCHICYLTDVNNKAV